MATPVFYTISFKYFCGLHGETAIYNMGFKMNRSVNANEIASHIEFEEFIAVFDSGMGGISSLIDLIKAFPNQKFVYFGDNINAPYGTKSKEEILNLSDAIAHSFVQAGAKAIVIACNTATSASIDVLRQKYTIPIVGIEPELEQAVIENAGKNIVVMGTNATLSGDLYNQKLQAHLQKKGKKAPHRVDSIPMPKLVEIVESGKLTQKDVEEVMRDIDKDIIGQASSIVLGCTHFVLLKSQIFKYMNDLGIDVKLYEGNAKLIKKLSDALKLDISRNEISYEQIRDLNQVILLTSDASKFDRMQSLFEEYFDAKEEMNFENLLKVKNMTKYDLDFLLKYVSEFMLQERFSEIDRELIDLKYFRCVNPNMRDLSRKHRKTLKYVKDRMLWLDNELFKFLSKKI